MKDTPYQNNPMAAAAAIPAIMLPAIEKLSIQASFFLFISCINTAMTIADTAMTISGVLSPLNVKTPFSETKPPRYRPMYVLTSPINMAVIAVSPKPADEEFPGVLNFLVYLLFRKIESTIPHMIQILISKAIVVNADGVISDADNVDIPACSAAACAICVS